MLAFLRRNQPRTCEQLDAVSLQAAELIELGAELQHGSAWLPDSMSEKVLEVLRHLRPVVIGERLNYPGAQGWCQRRFLSRRSSSRSPPPLSKLLLANFQSG